MERDKSRNLSEIKQNIRMFLEKTTKTYPLDDNRNVIRDRLLDSFGLVSLVQYLETEFNVTFDFEELTEESIGSVQSIASLLDKKLHANP